MKKRYTLNALLEEIKEQAPKFETGQFFEVLKSMYPDASIGEKIKNIVVEDIKATKPLACSSKAKRSFKKDKSPFCDFFKDNTRGDFLEIIETNGTTAKCINRSIVEEIKESHYSNDQMKYITIGFNDIINNNIRRVYRGINKYI